MSVLKRQNSLRKFHILHSTVGEFFVSFIDYLFFTDNIADNIWIRWHLKFYYSRLNFIQMWIFPDVNIGKT